MNDTSLRTSVDHGTAFDIAGTGQTDERALLEALWQAVELAPKTSFFKTILASQPRLK